MKQNHLSIIIPTLNEEKNIRELVERIDLTMERNGIGYEAIFVDDLSSDNTARIIQDLSSKYPISLCPKKGKKGKAQSLVEGFGQAKYDLIAVIDADLQYPPESLPEMVEKLNDGFDVVVANRSRSSVGIVRRIVSHSFNFLFCRLMHGLDCDVQAGMKAFKKSILKEIDIDPSPWTFDLEFLIEARNLGYAIGSVDIDFSSRHSGKSKISLFRSSWEIGINAIKVRLKKYSPIIIPPSEGFAMVGAGFAHKKVRFITHTTLQYDNSALDTFMPWQKKALLVIFISLVAGIIFDPVIVGIMVASVLSAVYFFDMIFNLYLVLNSLENPPEIKSTSKELAALDKEDLPYYSILCPLYKEAHMLPIFFSAIAKIDWPKEKLDVLLLLEENDPETIVAARSMDLPPYVRILVVPDSLPKTKPKACNYGLSYARGEYIVVYDAEDIPDPLQLKKAYLGFKKLPENIWCLQAKLNYFNPSHNLLTRLFTAEYSLWFDIVLPALQSINTSIPLGGTSNHFRRKNLMELRGWDPFNVTEDCDLGIRIFKKGYQTAIIDSVTLEEANSDLKNWLRQRSRWIKGFIQTFFVHMRHPVSLVKENGSHAFIFQLFVGGKTFFIFINPFLWLITASYFLMRDTVGPMIEQLYPSAIFYIAAVSFVCGNFLYLYYYMVGCAKRGQWFLVKYVFFVPFYWFLMSIASVIALYQLIMKPHFWEKTHHGLYLKKNDTKIGSADQLPESGSVDLLPEKKPYLVPGDISLSVSEKNLTAIRKIEPEVFDVASDFAVQERDVEEKDDLIYKDGAVRKIPRMVYNAAELLSAKFINALRTRSWLSKENTEVPDNGIEDREEASFEKYTVPMEKRSNGMSLGGIVLSGEAVLVLAILLSNFFNFAFNAYLGRILTFENLGTVIFVNTLWYVIAVIVGAFSTTVNHRSAFLSARKGRGASEEFLSSMIAKGLHLAVPFGLVWILAVPFLADFFHISDIEVLLAIAPVFSFGIIAYANSGFLKGNLDFVGAAAILLSESFSKLVLAIALSAGGYGQIVYLSIPLSILVAAGTSWFIVKNKVLPFANRKKFNFPLRFFSYTLLSGFSAVAFLSLDVILVKHFLPPYDAGRYVLLSLVGKMIYFFGYIPSAFMITFVSRSLGMKRNPEKTFLSIYILTALLAATGVILFGFFGFITVPLLLGPKAMSILPYLHIYTFSIALFTISNVIMAYHLARKKYIFPAVSFLMSMTMVVGIVVMHSSTEDIIKVIFWVSFIGWILMSSLHLLGKKLASLNVNILNPELAVANRNKSEAIRELSGKNILIFNWRDTRHKFAGGAEVYIQSIAKVWVKKGNNVTIFCGHDKICPKNEIIDGVEIVRRGGFYFVYVWAFIYYLFHFRGKYDVVIDCQNGIPFFTPLYVRSEVYCLMHHVHQEVFRRSLIKPLAVIARFLEKCLMPLVYKNTVFITVSHSSKKEIKAMGLGRKGIRIIYPGVDIENLVMGKKNDRPLVLYLGRLKAYKSIDVLVRAFRVVSEREPEAVLVIAGDGEEQSRLKDLVRELRFNADKVVFAGRISEKEKIDYLQRAWVLVNPSFMEGWGIVAIEAAACGTPVVASNVSGLRDSVKNRETGYLAPYGDIEVFSSRILKILKNKNLREKMGVAGRKWAKNFDWGKSSLEFLSLISKNGSANASVRLGGYMSPSKDLSDIR